MRERGGKRRKQVKSEREMTLEDYENFLLNPDDASLSSKHLHKIIYMHGFRRIYNGLKIELRDALSTVDLMESERSTIGDDESSLLDSWLPLAEVKLDLDVLNWQECPVQTIKTLDLPGKVNPPQPMPENWGCSGRAGGVGGTGRGRRVGRGGSRWDDGSDNVDSGSRDHWSSEIGEDHRVYRAGSGGMHRRGSNGEPGGGDGIRDGCSGGVFTPRWLGVLGSKRRRMKRQRRRRWMVITNDEGSGDGGNAGGTDGGDLVAPVVGADGFEDEGSLFIDTYGWDL